ncbi:hypothetical protein PV04_07754 [Phialophora macrospora]|uniref:CHAT domain-containing protein n=1 Tax=Phialophora macrospora TaxID=1851006 RepID=A0A0D2DTT1_9EURO|nr:hypothetical protein PV04_07754 [Phialophora macrospora]
MDQLWEAGNNLVTTPLIIYSMAWIEHNFAVKTRCQPDPKGRDIARKGLGHIQEACQALQGHLEMEAACRYLWAELILDQAVSTDHFKGLVPTAVEQYTLAQDLLDMIRQGIGESSRRFDDWTAKRRFLDDEDKESTPNNAVTCLILADKLVEAWQWIQRWKAASLAETVGLQARKVSMTRASSVAKVQDPEGFRMLDREDRLGEDLVKGRCGAYASLAEAQTDYNRLLAQLRQRNSMRPILSLRGQLPVSRLEFDNAVAEFAGDMVNVDWVHLGDSLLVVISRPWGRIDYEDLGDFDELMRDLNECFDEADLKTKSPERIFGQFDDVVKPLQRYTRRGEVLILSSTENMHRLPLHALMLNGEPLIKRNPVVYSYGASLMTICAVRRRASTAYRDGKAVVIGNPRNDSTKTRVAASMDESSRAVAMQLRTGSEYISRRHGVTNDKFNEAASGAAILHYHGHAKYQSRFATETGLMLAGGEILRPENMANLPLQEGAHVTLIACESGKQDISFGNEPLGMAPALFVAGACSVLATLWPIPSPVGQAFSESFYRHGLGKEARLHSRGRVNLARAVQRATLDVLEKCGENSSDWAAFTLRGFPEF